MRDTTTPDARIHSARAHQGASIQGFKNPHRPRTMPGSRGPSTSLLLNQCLVAAFALACARKKRIISRLASGPRASV